MSSEYNVTYEVLKENYLKLKDKNKPKVTSKPEVVKKRMSQQMIASRSLLFYMLKDEKVITEVEDNVIFFPDTNVRNLANEIIYFYHKYDTFKIADFISYVSDKEEEINLLNEIINMNINEKYKPEEITDYIKVVNDYPIKRK